MLALARLVVVGGIALTVVYLSVSWFVISTRRERLEREWDAANPDGDPAVRKAVVDEGVRAFKATAAYRALWLIYLLPAAVVTAVLVVTGSK